MFTINEIIQITRGQLLNRLADAKVKSVSIDTRTIKKGALYVAIKGDVHDGHAFLKQAQQKGAAAVLVHKSVSIKLNIPVIKVKCTMIALGQLAKYHRNRFDLPVVAITGSVGKTTTKDILASVLKRSKNVLKSPGSFNNHIGVPLTLFQLKRSHDVAVIEVATNQKGDIAYLAKIVQPTIVIFTNIGPSHLQRLKTLHGVFREKTQLLKSLKPKGVVIYNGDDALLQQIKIQAKTIRFAIHRRAHVRASQIKLDQGGRFQFKVGQQSLTLRSPIYTNISNALAVIACARELNISWAHIKQGLQSFRAPTGRQNIFQHKGVTIINDTYNANPLSFESALQTLSLVPKTKRRFVVCGDMLELGDKQSDWHKQIGRMILKVNVCAVVTYGSQSRAIHKLVCRDKTILSKHAKRMEEISPFLSKHLSAGDAVLVKASNGMKLQNVVNDFKAQ